MGGCPSFLNSTLRQGDGRVIYSNGEAIAACAWLHNVIRQWSTMLIRMAMINHLVNNRELCLMMINGGHE